MLIILLLLVEPKKRSRYSDWLWAGRLNYLFFTPTRSALEFTQRPLQKVPRELFPE
jgi:hypothetical protein